MVSWPRIVFRICCTVTAVLMFNQAVFAGQFLAGSFSALHTHRENATVAGISVLLTGAAAILVRLRGGGPVWPAYACLGLFGLIAAQIGLGFARVLAIHVPLGVAIIIVTLLLTGWSWRASPGSRKPTAAPGDRELAAGSAGTSPAALPGNSEPAALPGNSEPGPNLGPLPEPLPDKSEHISMPGSVRFGPESPDAARRPPAPALAPALAPASAPADDARTEVSSA